MTKARVAARALSECETPLRGRLRLRQDQGTHPNTSHRTRYEEIEPWVCVRKRVAGLERSTLPYPIQQPVRDDGSPILGPDGRPLFLPHFQLPAFVVFNDAVDARALGAYAFLQVFVDQSEGELSSTITAADIAARFGVSEETVMRTGNRAKNPPGLVPRLVQAHALVVGPNTVKTRDCEACGTEMASPCPDTCTSRKGRRRIKPRFELATQPPEGFLYPGPISRWEYYSPKKIAKRLRQEGPDSTLPPQNRREVVPFVQVLAWPALDRSIGLTELGLYVFIAAHTSLAEGAMATDESLFRSAIGRRFGWTENHVSEVTAKLERRKIIAKSGLIDGHGHRYGYTGEPTSYVVRVMPPAGLMHPLPIRVSEYRDEERITQRQEAVRSVPPASLRFPRVPSDLRIVDNSGYPQESTRANPGVWTGESGAVDGGIGDLKTNPSTHPGTHPSPSVGAQPQGRGTAVRGSGSSDGDEGSQEGGRSRPGAPAAAPAGPDLLALVERYVPRGLCKRGRADQEMLAARLNVVLGYGFTPEEIELVFDGITPETVLNPFAVVADRIKSVSRLREHLAKVAERRAAAAKVPDPRVPSVGRCGVHGTEYVPELSTTEVPFCLLCDRELREEAEAAGGRALTDGESGYNGSENVHEPEIEDLDPAVLASRAQESLASAGRAHRAPALNLATLLDEMLPAPEREYCGRCQQEGRYILVPSATSPDGYERRRCPRCG